MMNNIFGSMPKKKQFDHKEEDWVTSRNKYPFQDSKDRVDVMNAQNEFADKVVEDGK